MVKKIIYVISMITLFAQGVFAASIPITNSTFDDGTTGWTKGSSIGSYTVSTSFYTNYPAVGSLDGTNAAYFINVSNQSITQTLTNHIVEGEQYTLTVAVGDRDAVNGGPGFAGYDIRLLAGGITVATNSSTISPGDGVFTDVELVYTAQADDSGVLGIYIGSSDAGSDKALDVDNVRLAEGEVAVTSSITLSSLADHEIVQRDWHDQAALSIAGTFSGTGTEIQARAVAIDENGTDTGWITIDAAPAGESYTGTLDVSEGWYQIEVRLLNDTEEVATALISHVGIGDIYIICGQSNSANFGDGTPSADDERVSYLGLLTSTWVHAEDPPGNPSDYPGRKGSPWPKLGDLLSAQNDVPIGFVSIGDGSSSVESWMPASDDNYPNLQTAVQYFDTNGFKAVLWHQGEYDADVTSTEDYVTRLETVISASRDDAGWDIPWGVAQVSYPYTSTNIPIAQLQVIANDDLVFAGADTDTLGAAYRNGAHFTTNGLTAHAELWFDAINDAFPVADGLVAHWSLDEGSGSVASDSSGNSYNGTITNGTWTSGVDEKALDFNGTNASISLPAETFSSISNAITISMWVYGGESQPQSNSVLYAENASGDLVLNINLPQGDGSVYWKAGDDSGIDQIHQAASSNEYQGTWNHWAFTKDADTGTMNIYLNGSLWLSETGVTQSIGTVANAYLGSALIDRFYEGLIDDVRMYDYALSATAVSMLFSYYNASPVAYDVSISVIENQSDTVALNGIDPEGSNLIYTVASQPMYGDLSGSATNLTYTPNAEYTGSDSFTYTVSDDIFTSDEATVWITVVEDLVADDQSIKVKTNDTVTITLSGSSANDSSIGYTVTTDPTNGTLSGTAPYLTYAPDANFSGSDGFTFVVTDGDDESDPGTVSIEVIEDDSQWITWSDAVTISNANDVSTNGTSEWAYSLGATGSNEINGVTFAGETNSTGNIDVTTELAQMYAKFGNNSGTFSTLTSAYQNVLKSAAYSSGTSTIITLNGLTIGNQYEVQFWENDSRNRTDMETLPRSASISETTFVVDYNTTGDSSDDGLGQTIIGTFTADASTQEIELESVVPQLNAVQLRNLTSSSTNSDTYSVWIASYGLSGSDSLYMTDSDNDGINNLVEFALGMNPTLADAGSIVSITTIDEGEISWFEVIHDRRSDYVEQGLSYLLIDSTNLLTSTTHTNAQDEIIVGDAVDDYEPVTNRYEINDPNMFIQFKIHLD